MTRKRLSQNRSRILNSAHLSNLLAHTQEQRIQNGRHGCRGIHELFLALMLPNTRDVIRQHELVQESWRARFHRPERVQFLEQRRVRDPPPHLSVFSRFDQTRRCPPRNS